MKTNLFSAVMLTILCLVFFVVIYGSIVWGAAYFSAPNHGRGEMVMNDKGRPVGFALIGQTFNEDKYFWSRPSAVNYNAAGSAGSNKGPSNQEYLQTVKARIDTFLVHNPGIAKSQIPVDIITASGSGLDPDISPAAAYVQIKRIAKIRNADEAQIKALVDHLTEKPLLGFLGPEKINVLKLNVALDKSGSSHK